MISRDPTPIGRSTAVLNAMSGKWEKIKLVVKVSWPSSGRVSETEFLRKAIDEAEKTDGKWATKHLPNILYSKDVVFDQDSTLDSVARLFENAKFESGDYKSERLTPLKTLKDVKDIGQVFVDIACSTRVLFSCQFLSLTRGQFIVGSTTRGEGG